MKSSKTAKDKNPFHKKSGFKVLGIGKQEAIKYFFGGNATMAIIVISLIIFFLIYHAWSFFPDYRKSLTLYRQSGQEFTDYASEQITAQKELSSLAIQAREYEIMDRLGALYFVTQVHATFKSQVLKEISSERKELKRSESRFNDLREEDPPKPDRIKEAEKSLAAAREALRAEATKVISDLDYSDLTDKTWVTDKKYLESIRQSVVENIITGEDTEFQKSIKDSEAKAKAEIDALPFIQDLAEARKLFQEPQSEFSKFVDEIRKIAGSNKSQALTYSSAGARKEALLKAAELARDEETRKRKLIEAERVLTIEPDYSKLNEPLYNSLDKHQEVLAKLTEKTKEGLAKVPSADKFEGKLARRRINKIHELEESIFELFDEKRKRMEEWDHTAHMPMSQAVTGFFFGTKWVTNSSWQDFYGIIPLLAGSVCVALVAVVIAVPFSVGGAIYVNRLASPFEQKFIKPVIEFIGAIPSIVLAFFGVVVLGNFLVENTQYPIISWIPGLPVENRLTILNAGILLALMSVPTIFTLAEDALNNVPKSYKEASLALGATRIQTVLKVIIPSASSGIIAAVLLGFGRIIGETMVVLLVMGGRIAIPESITDPAHSMTGILAQEIGEVDEGSLHWGALFMVGLVLFVIALSLNYIAQTILRKFSKH
ncbi:Binding-protein-dependent transport system inner membrane component [Rubritalea squalenifaciens DSM 18772]|uniref:Phosphate transport system permease protein n=1 Tax=Rubritalea squalenifaciens DSM 18772 TaxID=1123071 RepID=A0A1M6ESA8_9BACT|nr:phosphate ABC transporter permease subunit PstC [Rubritalea squalenifaciens]SHI88308.1 Binding-protein-dependent transport system inner membrane component [Rubritalea squalenifaciens DSM 18772]